MRTDPRRNLHRGFVLSTTPRATVEEEPPAVLPIGSPIPPRKNTGGSPMPTAPPQRCTYPGCPNLTTRSRCPDHTDSGWRERPTPRAKPRTTYDRLGISQHQWEHLRRITFARHGDICHVCGKPGADQVDHIIAVSLGGSATDLGNLAPIHSEPCHRIKTARELARLRAMKRRRTY